jgi:hypothetical protein
MKYVCAVYIGWMAVMILIGFAGDLSRSPALLNIACALGLATPLMIGCVSIALILIAIYGKGDA